MKTITLTAVLLTLLSGALFAQAASAATKPGVLPCKRGIVYVCQ